MSNKIIFIDIDGPLIPARAYLLPKNQNLDNKTPFVMAFDHVAVSLFNDLAKTRDYKFVLHSSWIRVWGPEATLEHCIGQGLQKEYFHEHPVCNEQYHWRYDRVTKWLGDHPDTTHYVIVDDEPYRQGDLPHPNHLERHLLQVDFDEGLTYRNFRQIKDGNWAI